MLQRKRKFLMVILGIIYGIFLLNIVKETWKSPFNKKQELPLILAYTKFWFGSVFSPTAIKALENCQYKCRWSENKSLYPIADAVIFHMWDFKWDNRLIAPRNPNTLNIFYSRECADMLTVDYKNIPKDFFNVTLTFRRDSTIFKPYDRLDPILDSERSDDSVVWTDAQIEEQLKQKTGLVIKIFSRCKAASKREKYIDALKEYLNVTIYGGCANKRLPRSKTGSLFTNKTEGLVSSHYFYLSFENSVCKDYISEKFWHLKKLTVPVVLKRSLYKGIAEDEYFIAADDYASPKELADKLIALSQNMTEYKKYLGWTKKYKKTSGFDEREMCRICEMATKKERHIVPDIRQWWQNEAECEKGFAETLLNRSLV